MADYSLRFDDLNLHARFLSELISNKVAHHVTTLGTIECSEDEWCAVNQVAHTIRDSCYRWFFYIFKTTPEAERYLLQLRKSKLPFQIEHHKDQIILLLAKAYEDEYDQLWADHIDDD